MSIKIMSCVWDITVLKGSDKLVMLCLSDFANDEGLCWPSIETIARKSGVSVSTVKSTLKKLVEAKWLKKENQFKRGEGGRNVRGSNKYLLNVLLLRKEADKANDEIVLSRSQAPDFEQPDFERSKSEQSNFERSKCQSGGGQNSARGGAKSGYKPSLDPSIDPSSKDLAPSKLEATPPAVISIKTNRKGEDYPVLQSDVFLWKEAYPLVDIMAELKKYQAWSEASPRKRKTLSGVKPSIVHWLANEQNKGRYLPPEQQTQKPKSEDDQIQTKIRELEMAIDGENEQLTRLSGFKGTEPAQKACDEKIKRLLKERKELVAQLGGNGNDQSTRKHDGFAQEGLDSL